jgi:hypothetical protein
MKKCSFREGFGSKKNSNSGTFSGTKQPYICCEIFIFELWIPIKLKIFKFWEEEAYRRNFGTLASRIMNLIAFGEPNIYYQKDLEQEAISYEISD